MTLLALTKHDGIRLAEFGFLLEAVAGAIIVFGALSPGARGSARLLGGLALSASGVLLIIAVHWGHFG
jgi:hypothetical protein